ncbi:polyphosphate--glucose phosphotransferase [Williamsia deligens]|uniref:Polyphosphate--glucose phosphotransferase n=1 Tax=Williamsia deligens TaxID=321325 RepID=A0ABW3GBK8_9NOCA|nr:ROK family protein [Williamsia deligens]MCP2195399.1 polyphosphate glucokinase [Williamsia deligens]
MATDSPADSVPARAFGVDVGGSGIKGGVVDLTTGELVGDRHKVLTPQPSTPEAVAGGIREVVDHFGWTGPVGITLPSVVSGGIVRTAANIDKGWIGTDPYDLLTRALGDRTFCVLNDADAAGMAEDAYGAGRDRSGLVILLTFGTGIGSAVLFHGNLVPNTELGHMEVGGKEAEHQASSKVKDDKEMSYEKWAGHVSTVLTAYENLFWPDLFIVGGGISRKADKWVPHLTTRTPVVPATLQNTAGIVGAAMAVTAGLRP